MIDLKLNETSHDLDVTTDTFDLTLIHGREQIKQNLKNRLLFLFEEWYLDGSQGVKYRELVFVKNPDMNLVNNVIKGTILDTQGVVSITAYSSTYSAKLRSLTVTFSAETSEGLITSTQVVV